jgi:exonuclease III
MSSIKIGTWNLCLGLRSKKDLVQKYIIDNNLDVCCVQQTKIDKNFNEVLLTFLGYSIEVENNDVKRQVAIYMRNRLNYRRRAELEGTNCHLVIVDLLGRTELRVVTVYRTFKPPENITARENLNCS